jgi:CRP-like cAMP-binding protein
MDRELLAQLTSTVQRYHALSSNGMDLVAAAGERISLPRDAHLAEQGRPDASEYFLLEGILHRYVTGGEGEPLTTAFHTGGTVLTPHFARTVNGRSLVNLQALVPATVVVLPVAELDRLRYAHVELRLFGLRVVEQELVENIRQGIAFRERSARERLLAFRRDFPGLENQVPHTTIASFLGITPVSFSRLRKELART